MSFSPVTQYWISPVPQMHWIWRMGLVAQPARGQLHTRVGTAACGWTVLRCQQARDVHVIFLIKADALFIIAFKILGVGRLGASGNHLPAQVRVSQLSRFVDAFNTCLFLGEEGSEVSTFCWALRLSGKPDALLQKLPILHRRDASHPSASAVGLQPEGLETWPSWRDLEMCPCLKDVQDDKIVPVL